MIGPTVAVLAAALTAAAIALYLLPLLIGCARHAPDLAALAVVNIALGWTFVGWIVALAMALRTATPPLLVQVLQPMPPVTAAPPGPSAGWSGPGGPLDRPPDAAPPLALPPQLGPQEGPHGT